MIASSDDLLYFIDENDLTQNKFTEADSDLLEQGISSNLTNTIKTDLCFK
jgi:hypothetical protein